MPTDPFPTYDDEIDLRAIVLTLWRAHNLILVVTLAAAIAAFVISSWILPRQYQATAYVFIGEPALDTSDYQTDSGLTVSPIVPDIEDVVTLSTTSRLLESVHSDPAVVAAVGNEEITLADIATAAYAVDTYQLLSLQITDNDPQRAALLANTWAEKVTATVNASYGLDAIAQALDSQVLQSQQIYNQAQAALEEVLSQIPVDALDRQISVKQEDLLCKLKVTSQTMRVLDDLQSFEQGLTGVPGKTTLSMGDGLALTTLRQRSLTSQECQDVPDFTVQIDGASLSGFTVSKARETATQMRAGLKSQLTRLQSDQSRLEQEIPPLQRDLENSEAQLDEFTMKRDQSQGIYFDLLQLQQQNTRMLAQLSKVASVSVEALPPANKSSTNAKRNTLLAGMLGLMLSAFWVLVAEWWKNSNETQDVGKDVSRM